MNMLKRALQIAADQTIVKAAITVDTQNGDEIIGVSLTFPTCGLSMGVMTELEGNLVDWHESLDGKPCWSHFSSSYPPCRYRNRWLESHEWNDIHSVQSELQELRYRCERECLLCSEAGDEDSAGAWDDMHNDIGCLLNKHKRGFKVIQERRGLFQGAK